MKTESRKQKAESRKPLAASRSTLHAPRSTLQSAVALVITLVLLSVITFMAVTFLVVSRSQHGSVATETDNALARLAADTARERAIVQLLAPMMAWTNEFNYGLLVSTNYISSDGFISRVISPLNVSYNYSNGTPLVAGPPNYDFEQNIANLLYDPRPPVFITNRLVANSNEFRFYVDLNRNGRDDPSGLLPVINPQGGFYDQTTGNPVPYKWPPPAGILSNLFVGDPEWIGVLQHPEFAHSADNLFISRYAYLVVPAGQTLDVNCIHNDANSVVLSTNRADDGFLRNQGVGTWEINLAAFLADLNTNYWNPPGHNDYEYLAPAGTYPNYPANSGVAFEDASRLLLYRYRNNWKSLASVASFFPGNGRNVPGATAFSTDFIDGYSAGPFMTNTWWQPGPIDADFRRTKLSWSGSDNPNRFYTTQDLFDRNKLPPTSGTTTNFGDRLQSAGAQADSYDRYTFYRLLSALGTDSAPEPSGKMNLNYCNVTNGYVVANMATNFIPWSPTNFFINAAIRLLADAGYTVGDSRFAMYGTNLLVTNVVNGLLVTNLHIPLSPTNLYTASVHRLLQLAANIYDATTNRVDLTGYPYLPTIFRPVFSTFGGKGRAAQVFIVSYQEVTAADTTKLLTTTPIHDLSDPKDLAVLPLDLVYNVPLVIGAKKGFPNFNEFAMHTHVRVTRKLQFVRQNGQNNAPIIQTNQMFMVAISNVFGVEAWNSYSNNWNSYPSSSTRPLRLYVWPDIRVVMTNELSQVLNPPPQQYKPLQPFTCDTNDWSGYVVGTGSGQEAASFILPLSTNLLFLTNSIYRKGSGQFVPASGPGSGTFEVASPPFYVPHWGLNVKSLLRFAVVDTSVNRIVDYVNLSDQVVTNLTEALSWNGQCGDSYNPSASYGSFWCTNHYPTLADENLPTYGMLNQMQVSLGIQPYYNSADWNSAINDHPAGMGKEASVDFFRWQFNLGPLYTHGQTFNKSNTFAAPFQPFRNIYLLTSWQANDPLVHYTASDLTDPTHANLVFDKFDPTAPDPVDNLGQVNRRYEPWGGGPYTASSSPTLTDTTVKDPLMLRSDSWDFPANKLPNPGWLGRVHRGTPWQTVYFKSFGVTNYQAWFNNWPTWTGNRQVVTNFGQLSTDVVPINNVASDALFTQPINDGHLLDLFTTALNDNATRGQLSINQTDLAAWSAVLSGVLVFTNTVDAKGNGVLSPQIIQPAGVYNPFDTTNAWPPLVQLVKRINDVRATNNARHVFGRLSDILAVPELTVASPFLNTLGTPSIPDNGLDDAAIERLPQQIAGLLKTDPVPRFVIYAFGQTLKPALRAPFVTSGPFAGLCTNYQIMAEAATRTVVRFEGIQPYQRGPALAITNLHPVIESFNVLPPD